MTGGKILWAMDADGEIGKRPALEPHLFEIDGDSLRTLPLLGRKRR